MHFLNLFFLIKSAIKIQFSIQTHLDTIFNLEFTQQKKNIHSFNVYLNKKTQYYTKKEQIIKKY